MEIQTTSKSKSWGLLCHIEGGDTGLPLLPNTKGLMSGILKHLDHARDVQGQRGREVSVTLCLYVGDPKKDGRWMRVKRVVPVKSPDRFVRELGTKHTKDTIAFVLIGLQELTIDQRSGIEIKALVEDLEQQAKKMKDSKRATEEAADKKMREMRIDIRASIEQTIEDEIEELKALLYNANQKDDPVQAAAILREIARVKANTRAIAEKLIFEVEGVPEKFCIFPEKKGLMHKQN